MGLDMTVYKTRKPPNDGKKIDGRLVSNLYKWKDFTEDDGTKHKAGEETHIEVEKTGSEELHYWRKHSDLHGYISNMYVQNGGIPQEMSKEDAKQFKIALNGIGFEGMEELCANTNSMGYPQTLELDTDNINEIESAIKERRLPKTTGFFFGESYSGDEAWGYAWHDHDDMEFIENAREALKLGYYLYYKASW